MGHDDIVAASEAIADELVPDLADRYGLEIEVPDFKGTRAGYTGIGTAMEYHHPTDSQYGSDAGTVKVREDTRWPDTVLTATVGHELGHAALYQHSDFQQLREDDSYDDYALRAISEGIAQHVERTVYRSQHNKALKQLDLPDAARYSLRYTVTRGGQRLWDATVARKYPDAYADGRELMTGMDSSDIHDIITDPEQFYHEIVDQL